MRLKVIELLFEWPEDVSLKEIRPWLLNQLIQYGEPLRWSITSISLPNDDQTLRQLRVEAVLIIP